VQSFPSESTTSNEVAVAPEGGRGLRLLVLTPQEPYPPHQGTALRNYNLIARLARRHQIHLLSFHSPEGEPSDLGPLSSLCTSIATVPPAERKVLRRLWTTIASPLPDMAHRLASPTFREALARTLRTVPIDVVQFEGIEMIPYLGTVLSECRRLAQAPRLVFDDHNAEYVLQRRVWQTDARNPLRWPGAAYSLIQWRKLRAYEAWACRSVDVVVAVSETDAEALRQLVPGLEVLVIPNGVDIAHYTAYGGPSPLPPFSLVFTGKMDFRPNVDAVLWFTRHVFPSIHRRVPEVRFYVVGQRPHPRLDRLRDVAGITVTGHVPDIRPYIAGAAVYIVPLRSGGGTRLKVLEAMALRRAIVSTSMGCAGFPVRPGRDVVIADDAEAFADAVVSLLFDGKRRHALGEAAFRFAQRGYDWAEIVPRLESAYGLAEDGECDHAISCRVTRSGA